MTRALLFSMTTSADLTSSRNAARPSGLARSMQTPRLLRFISLKYMARWWGWRWRSWIGPDPEQRPGGRARLPTRP